MEGETVSSVTPPHGQCVYTACYCEENVWKLCDFVRTARTTPMEQLHVLFISNENRTVRGGGSSHRANVFSRFFGGEGAPQVPLWKQKSRRGEQPVIWDYHVVLLHTDPRSDSLIYDLDSDLPFPCRLELYINQALRSDRNLRPEYHRKLRVIPANVFLSRFSSDRSHMKNCDGTWKMPPPVYPPISTTESKMNLDDFISVSPDVGWGEVYSLQSFIHLYSLRPAPSEPSSAPL